ncbi:MAG: oligopeptidase A [Gammaproteobacteria bacterium]
MTQGSSTRTGNPLLCAEGLPAFSRIRPEHVEPAVDQVLAQNRARLDSVLAQPGPFTFANLVQPLEAMDEDLSRAWAPVSHLHAVLDSEALRAAYNACLDRLSEYATELGQNQALYRAYQTLAGSPEYARLQPAQRKIIDDALRDFRLSGIGLDAPGQSRYRAIQQELAQLTSRFQENLLDATHAWKKTVSDESLLSGMPESARQLARQTAAREGQEGWLLTLEFPSYHPVMTYADRPELRREMYEAYTTRASDQGPNAGQWDNTSTMERILALRHELATLLGFGNYAEYSLATKMARDTSEVMGFLQDLARRSVPKAREEFEELCAFARERFDVTELHAWDVAYYAEKLREHRYAITQEELKPYFPQPRVLSGMFAVVEQLYGIHIREMSEVDTWHPDVRFYEIRDRAGALRGHFYLDLYARPHKRGGAWMDECLNRKRTAEGLQTPVAHLVCNFSPPIGNEPALFTHDDVITLFHEFGHGLHHMLTQVDFPSVAGINRGPGDAVELPSQFMENWCWERAALDLIAAHYRTGEPLPEALYERMLAARNFHSAMQMVRQLEFALFDFRIHMEYTPGQGGRIYEILRQVREQVSVVPAPGFSRFAHGFSHIFAGGYAAGYYSYKWAEVLSADAFAAFEEQGGLNPDTGQRFLATILERGGSRDPMELFMEFRGRAPSIDALLRHSGLAA